MRPALKPGLLPVWRDRDTLQIGIDPRRAVALSGVGASALLFGLIGLLDGSRDLSAMIAAACDDGIPAEAAHRVITLLAAAGVLDDFPAATLRAVPDGVRSRLGPERATAALARGDTDGGARVLARRSAAYVRVYGAGRAGSAIAALLAASGVGHVSCRDSGTAFAADLSPAGLSEADIGAPRSAGVARAIRRSAPEVRTDDDAARPDLVVLTGRHGPELAAELTADGVPHLAVSAGEAIGIVGPLVIPGRSACLRCLDLARTDRDPAWPTLLAQLIGRQPDVPACDATLATNVAATASAQLLAFIDSSGTADAVTNGTLELVLPDWQWRRRTWLPHIRCGCTRDAASTGSTACSGAGAGA
ncbi:MAG TPA: ThiF family adenylyltransferase [Streptosporangiaceae bacterium]|jgi:hypothetical protein